MSMVYCFILLVVLSQQVDVTESRKQKRLVLDGELNLEQEIIQLKAEVARLKANTGSTYIRWGRTTCPGNGTGQVYEGYMAGTSSDRTGSPANYVCLPSDPSWDYYEDDLQDKILITGIEYEFWPHIGDSATHFFGKELRGAEAPCSLCRTPRSSNVMIPGRTDCYSGWTKEYSGYLVGGYPGYHHSSVYACLDRRPEMVPHSGTSDHENMLYFVEGSCGKNLACPPYVHGRELACVVCSM